MRGKRQTIWGFPEELKPCGDRGLKIMKPLEPSCIGYKQGQRADILTAETEKPWWIILWEPLPTNAPGPQLTSIWCCYANSIIFYVRGYIVRPFHRIWKIGFREYKAIAPGSNYEEWDHCDSLIRCDDVVEWKNQFFKVYPGRVVYRKKRWWVFHPARRENNQAN